MQERIAAIIEGYDAQGFHRTGTAVDNQSAEWLAAHIERLGVRPLVDTFSFKRIQVKDARFRLGAIDIEGVPLYDCGYTEASGIEGSVGEVGSNADIGVAMTLPTAAAKVDEARRHSAHKAIVVVSDQCLPPDGVATLNAASFLKPYGPPVLQVPNRRWHEMRAAIGSHSRGTVVAHCEYVDASASNVRATVAGGDPGLSPLVVMTPRSGWWNCASERGGGVAAFLEIMRAIRPVNALRTVIFTANTGHELGHTGLDHYLEANPDLVERAHAWIHLGANFAARVGGGVRLQYSDEGLKALVMSHAERQQVEPASETPVGSRPLGEARNVYDGGGSYVSIVGSNGLFHHPNDRFPDAVDLSLTTKWVSVFAGVAMDLVRNST